MKGEKKYEVLLMDVDGTLLDFDKAEAEAFRELLKKYGFSPEPALVEEYHDINKQCWEAFEEGRMEREQVLTGRFERFFKAHGRDVDGQEAENFYRIHLGKGTYLIDGAIELCQYLKPRYELYVVTNGIADTQRVRLKKSGLLGYFKGIFISEDAGSQKPQKEFFDYCFAHIPHASPEKMLLIGDSLTSDIRGGQNAGIDTCWFNPERRGNEAHIPVDYEIDSLEKLRNIL